MHACVHVHMGISGAQQGQGQLQMQRRARHALHASPSPPLSSSILLAAGMRWVWPPTCTRPCRYVCKKDMLAPKPSALSPFCLPCRLTGGLCHSAPGAAHAAGVFPPARPAALTPLLHHRRGKDCARSYSPTQPLARSQAHSITHPRVELRRQVRALHRPLHPTGAVPPGKYLGTD